jgi:hypothetical protein
MYHQLRRLPAASFAILSILAVQPSRSDTSPTQAQVTSDGGAIKSGDVIIWTVNKKVTLQVAKSAPVSATPTQTAAAGPTPGDIAAAAAAVKASADKLAKAAGPLAQGASADQVAKFNATSAAADQAAAAVVKANSDAFLAGASKAATIPGTHSALGKIVSEATGERDKAAKAVATQPGAAADAKSAAASAYLVAATDALTTSVTAVSASDTSTATTTDGPPKCFPADSLFQVSNVVAASTTPADSSAKTTASNTQLVSGSFSSKSGWSTFHFRHRNALNFPRDAPGGVAPPDTPKLCGSGVELASYDQTYDFTADQLRKQDFVRLGFTWGVLVIPYKFYLTDRSIKSNSSTVAFAGYEGWFPGASVSAVVALGPGLTTSSTSTTSTGTPSTTPSTSTNKSTTFVTYTAATGLIAAFGDSKTVKAGLLIGWDFQGKGSGFQYEGKTWLALSIGAGF